MNILINDIYSTIECPGNYSAALARIRSLCRARPAGYKFMPKFKAGRWDGYISLMHSFSEFPTGLLDMVTSDLIENGLEFSLIYNTQVMSYIPVTSDILNGVTLREYQVLAANTMLERQRGVVKMATNSGKTEVMAAVIKALDCNTLILLHRKELMYQTAQRFKDRGLKHVGIVGDGHSSPDKITIGMIQTLSAHQAESVDVFAHNQLVMCDETHHASSDTMMDMLRLIPGSYRYGLSGTPLKYDVLADMKLISATGNLIFDLDNAYMIEAGYSAVPIIHVAAVESKHRLDWKMKYQDAYASLIVNNTIRNQHIVDFVKKQPGIVLILVTRIEHGMILNDLIPKSVFVSGSDTTEFRQQVLDSMRHTTSGVYIASPIFDEGIDVPSVNAVVMAGGGVSDIKLLQRIGRGLRHKENGANVLHILDFIDDTNKYLLEHSNARISTYVGENFHTEMV